MTVTVIPERLAQLDDLTLLAGSHSPGTQQFCFNEAAAWLAGEPHTDAPKCVSPVLRRYTMALNDRWDIERRQTLTPYLVKVIGTSQDGKDDARIEIATRYLCTDLLGPWLRLAGMDEQADSLAALTAATPREIRSALYRVRDETWKLRGESLNRLKAKVREHLANSPSVADVAAAADAVAGVAIDAAADVAVDAVADVAVAAGADAVAVAVAAAAIDAVAAAAAAADADAVADVAAGVAIDAVTAAGADVAAAVAAGVAAGVAAAAGAAAAADAVAGVAAVADAAAGAAAAADAVADAVAAADAAAYPWAQYKAARQYFRDHPLPVTEKIRELAAEQQPMALVLLDRLIDPEAVAS